METEKDDSGGSTQCSKPEHTLKCFVSSSFASRLNRVGEILEKYVSEEVFEETRTSEDFRHAYRIKWNRLDREPFVKPTIQQNVFNAIQSSHICVADITPEFEKCSYNVNYKKKVEGQDENEKMSTMAPNPSVMHEIGYAHGLDVPVLYIGQKGTCKELPANIQGTLVQEYTEEDLTAENPSFFSTNLARTISNYINRSGALRLPGQFRVDGFRTRADVEIPYMIRNAKERIYVLTTNLEYIVENFLEAMKAALDWSEKTCSDSRSNTLKLDILTMDPESIVTNARAKQINEDVAKFRDSLRENLKRMKDFSDGYPYNAKIGTYVTLPTMILFVIDNAVVWSVPFPSQQSRSVPHFSISQDKTTIEQFVSHFFSVKSQAASQSLL